jgi:hypothetical protein
MKIRIDYTLDVDPKVIKQLMQKRWLADSDETMQSFVRSQVISVGVQCLNESLFDACLPDDVYVIKTNI